MPKPILHTCVINSDMANFASVRMALSSIGSWGPMDVLRYDASYNLITASRLAQATTPATPATL
jgi:hypothetical protein